MLDDAAANICNGWRAINATGRMTKNPKILTVAFKSMGQSFLEPPYPYDGSANE